MFLKSYRKLGAWNSQTSLQCIEDVPKSDNLQYSTLVRWADGTNNKASEIPSIFSFIFFKWT